MRRNLLNVLIVFAVGVSLSCGKFAQISQETSSAAKSTASLERLAFQDRTEEIVRHAQRLIEKNEREGAILDQQWYAARRFGRHQELFFGAQEIFFYGGREADVQASIQNRYLSIVPIETNQDPGEIRFFNGHLMGGKRDSIIIGQNGREVALKTIIRLIYLAKFADDPMRRKHRLRLQPFIKSLKIFMSPVSARNEYRAFFDKYKIRDPDAVLIGFMGDSKVLLSQAGFAQPEPFSDETLRVIWYRNVNGKKVLLISINGNRIFASRAGELMRAVYDISPKSRPSIIFLGSAGAIDAPEMVGEIIAPLSVMNGDPFPNTNTKGALIHLVRNAATDLAPAQSMHASVESVVVETTRWAARIKSQNVRTVDQELYHIVDAIHASARGAETELYAGVLVTDNVSTDKSDNQVTLEQAEETIEQTDQARKQFLLGALRRTGILKQTAPQNEEEDERRRTGTSG